MAHEQPDESEMSIGGIPFDEYLENKNGDKLIEEKIRKMIQIEHPQWGKYIIDELVRIAIQSINNKD